MCPAGVYPPVCVRTFRFSSSERTSREWVKLPLFYVLVVVQTRTARAARLGFIFAGCVQFRCRSVFRYGPLLHASGCPLSAMTRPTIGYPVAAAKLSLRLHVPKTMVIHARSMRSVDSVSCTLIHFSLLFTGKLSHLVQLDVVGITLRSIIRSHSTNLVLGLEQCLGGLLVD